MVAPTAPPTNTSAVPNIAPCCQKLTKVGAITNLVKQALPNPFPAPPPHHATVAVSAVGLNYADVFTCLGLYAASPRADFVPGLEFAGTVVALGPAEDEGTKKNTPPAGDTNNTNSSPQFPIGERVMGVVRFGAYASHIHVPLKQLQPLPGAWSFEQGAAFLVQALTAIYGLKSLGDLQPGARVLIQSAAGGVGLQAVAICLACNAIPVCLVGSESKIPTLTSRFPQLDARTQIFVRPTTGAAFAQQLKEVGYEYDVVFDAVGGPFFQPAYDCLAKGGRYIVYGAASMTPVGDRYLQRPRVDVLDMPGANKAIMGFNLIYLFDKVDKLRQLAADLEALDLPAPLVGETFPFDQAVEAIRTLQSGKTVGKVVLRVGDEVAE